MNLISILNPKDRETCKIQVIFINITLNEYHFCGIVRLIIPGKLVIEKSGLYTKKSFYASRKNFDAVEKI